MRATFAALAAALAAFTAAQDDVASKPFRLVLSSDVGQINGQYLAACHSGAAIESLCLTNSTSTSKPDPIPAATFGFNTSANNQAPVGGGTSGILTFDLQADPVIPSSLSLFVDPTTNYALPLFYPGTGPNTQLLVFDSSNKLGVTGYVDYTTNPPTAGNTTSYYRWYACSTYFTGYNYVNLVWALGNSVPETPGCAKVEVERLFV